MATNDRKDCSDVQFLSHSYTEGFRRLPDRSPVAVNFQLPRTILEERAKSWESLFEKYSMKITDAAELNLETLKSENETRDYFVQENRIPLRNPPSTIQYWVDTGKPPCLAYIDVNYNSDSETSLSEAEITVPSPAAPSPFGYNSPHSPQPANIPHEVIKPCLSVVSSDSVNTRDYILSSNIAKKQQPLAIIMSVKSPQKVVETNVIIEDTYVDVCGTDEPPKIAEKRTQSSNLESVDSQNTTIVYPFPTLQNSAILRVATGSLKLGDVIPSLQRIHDGPENYNAPDVYSDKLPSEKSEDTIVFERNHPTPPKDEEPVNDNRYFNRRKLFTNRNSPTDLIAPTNNRLRRMLSSSSLHPALQEYELVQHQRKSKKKSFLLKRSGLQDPEKNQDQKINGEGNEVNNDNSKDKALLEEETISDRDLKSKAKKTLRSSRKKRRSKRTALEVISQFEKVFDDDCLKKKPVVRLKKISDSFIRRSRRKKVDEENSSEKVPFEARSRKKKKDAEAKKVNEEFANKKELKIRDLIISLERLPIVKLERISQKKLNLSKSRESLSQERSVAFSPEKISSEELSTHSEKNVSNDFKKSLEVSKQKCITFVESHDDDSRNQKSGPINSKKSHPVRKKLITQIARSSSDEEGVFVDVNEENFTTGSSKIEKNTQENIKNSTKFILSISSDEDDDFTDLFEKNSFLKTSKTSKSNSKSEKITLNGLSTSYGSFPDGKLDINGLKTKSSDIATDDQLLNNFHIEMTSDNCDNLRQKNDELDVENKDKKDVLSFRGNKLNSFETSDTRSGLKLVVVSSSDSSDTEKKVEVSSKKAKKLENKSLNRKSSSGKKISKNKKNSRISTKFTRQKSNIEKLEGKSNSISDCGAVFENRSDPSIVSENRKYSANAKRIESWKKSSDKILVETDSDSGEELNSSKKKLPSHLRKKTKQTDQLNGIEALKNVKSSFTQKKLTLARSSSDEEEIFVDVKKEKGIYNRVGLGNDQVDDRRLKQNSVINDSKSSINESENVRKSTKFILSISSDEDDDYTNLFKKSSFQSSSKTSNRSSKYEEVTQNGVSTSYESFRNGKSNGLKTKSSDNCDNLRQKNDELDVENKDKKDVLNFKRNKLNSFETSDTRSGLKLVVVSSSDTENKVEVSSKKAKKLENKSFNRKLSFGKKLSENEKNLRMSTEFIRQKPNLENTEEEKSNSISDYETIFENKLDPSIVSENQKLTVKNNKNAQRIESWKKSSEKIFEEDSDSDEVSNSPKNKLPSYSRMKTKQAGQTNETKVLKKEKSSPAKKKLTLAEASSDEEDIFVNVTEGKPFSNQVGLSNDQVDNRSPKQNSVISNSKISVNKPENIRKSTMFVISTSSDEDDDYTNLFKKSTFLQSSKPCSSNIKSKKITFNGVSSSHGSSPDKKLDINGLKRKGSNVESDGTLQQLKKIRREVEDTNGNSSSNIFDEVSIRESPNLFCEDHNSNSSESIFGPPRICSEDEIIFNFKFKNRFQK